MIGIGLPVFLTLWDKTRGNMNVRGMVAMNRQPAFLTTRNPNIKSVRDFTDNDRIALPAPKVSVQAIMLQMIAEKTLGKFDALDRLTVGMSHPDGTAAMMSGKLEITSHFTSAPVPWAHSRGTRPMNAAATVIIFGRILFTAPSWIACSRSARDWILPSFTNRS